MKIKIKNIYYSNHIFNIGDILLADIFKVKVIESNQFLDTALFLERFITNYIKVEMYMYPFRLNLTNPIKIFREKSIELIDKNLYIVKPFNYNYHIIRKENELKKVT